MPALFVPFLVIAGAVGLCVLIAHLIKPPAPLTAYAVAAFLGDVVNGQTKASVEVTVIGGGWHVVIAHDSQWGYWVESAVDNRGRTYMLAQCDRLEDWQDENLLDLMDDDARDRLMKLLGG